MNQTYTLEQIIGAFSKWLRKLNESPEECVTVEYFLSLLEEEPS